MIPLACALAGPLLAELTVADRGAGRSAERVDLLRGDRELGAERDRRRDGRADGVRRGLRRPGRADGDPDALASVHAAVVPRRAAEGGARNLRRDAHVRAGAAAPGRPRLGAGHRRDDLRRGRRRERRALPRLPRPVHPPPAAGRGGLARRRRRRGACSWRCSRPTAPPEPPTCTPARHRRSRCAAGGAGAIQAIDDDGLLATAIRHDCLLVLPHAVGDIVPHGDVVVQVYGSPRRRRPSTSAACS